MDDNEIRTNFGKNLVKLRKYNKLSQQDLANKLSYSDKAISKWELGDNIPDIVTLHRIAELFNVTVDDLINKDISTRKSRVRLEKRILITSASSGGAFLLGLIGLLVLSIVKNRVGIESDLMQKFVFMCYPLAFFCASIPLIAFSFMWFERIWQFLAISVCLWSLSIVGMIWMDFDFLWIVILITIIINVITALILRVGQK